jgi:hypothetical protein
MILLLLSLAAAAEPQVFDEFPADVVVAGKTYAGILVDEATYEELIRLRVSDDTKTAELKAFETWKAEEDARFTAALGLTKKACEEGQTLLVSHYEDALKTEKKKDFWQRQGFPVGVAAGLVGATAIYLGAVHLYGDAITVE